MKFTIANKIIFGFAIITALLIFIGISSLMSVSTLAGSTHEITKQAYPMQQASTGLQSTTLAISKLGLKGYYELDLQNLSQIQEKLAEQDAKFDKNLGLIKQLQIKGYSEINELATQYKTLILNVFAHRKASIEANATLSDKSMDVEDATDTASSLLIDLADEGVESNVSATIRKAESSLEVVLNYLYEVDNVKNMSMYETYEAATNIYLNNLSGAASELKSALQDNQALSDYGEEFQDATKQVVNAFNSSSGFLSSKKAQLNSDELAEQSLHNSEALLEQLTASLSNLSEASEKFVAESELDMTASINNSELRTYGVIGLSLIVAIAITVIVLRSITSPLERINSALSDIAIGDLRTRLDDSHNDELGQLAKSCNKVVEGLRDVINEITSNSAQTASAAEQMSNITTATASEIQRQKQEVDQIASATMEMSSASELVARSAQESSEQIGIVSSEADNVIKISDYNAETIEKLAEKIESASKVIDQLSVSTDAIGGILDVIRGVAEQTNLLALNAAIEAARAGEHGRGFAVVADEVRTLASRTQESTSEIQNMIESLQKGTQEAVGVMQSSKAQAIEVVDLAKQSSDALLNISRAITTANEKSYEIANSANEQNSVSEEINQKLMSIVEITDSNSDAAAQTSESSQEVARLSGQLLNSVQKFKI